jgi:hypothetical protein
MAYVLVCCDFCPVCSSPLDPSVSQYDWGGDYADSLTSLDPLSSMMGELDYDVKSAPANGEAQAAHYKDT